MQRSVVHHNDVLLNITGASIGRVARFDLEATRANVNQHVCIIRSKPNELSPRYLEYFLSSPSTQHDINNHHQHGGTRQALTFAQISTFKIPLPPLSEQKRIADILDKADAIRRKRQEAIAFAEDIANSLYSLHLKRSRSKPQSIADLLDSSVLLVHKDGNYGGSYPRKHEFGAEGIPFLTAKHVAGDGTLLRDDVPRLNEDKARTLPFGWIQDGDVLLAHNATVGRVGLYHGEYEEALIGTSLTCFRPNPEKLNSQFLFAALRSSHFQQQLEQQMSQTTRNQVPITAQRRLTLQIPSLEVQEDFGRHLRQLHQLREHQVNSLDASSDLFDSLVQRAFNGEV